ncbi:MAG TPA: type I phosphomannose isomerase catalytic subunit [Verrucomicrobiae bacterium]|nr:type I phosphomannose isomerase catalytic subunit [Verrucomicrobiae bacterium]
MLYPLTFQPIFKERVWGNRKIETLYGKPLPPSIPIGESWEISDRPGDVSIIANGPLTGKDLQYVMQHHQKELLGHEGTERFPLLIKILDAQEKLSLQVHPPASVAASLKGEPKTEMWYITDAAPTADLFVGLNPGVTREQFEKKIHDGTVAECFHRIPVKAGDAMFLPSGRVHAIGAGLVIFEIQQNSDTTYRVFDWNRVGLDGKPRPLHIRESLASIDFNDFEPPLIQSKYSRNPTISIRFLVDHPLFRVDACKVKRGQRFHLRIPAAHILAIVKGRVELTWRDHQLLLKAGDFVLLPLSLERVTLTAQTQLEYLQVHVGK